jgi:hypothetical protein
MLVVGFQWVGVSKWGSGTMRKNEEEKMTDGEKKYIWPVPDQS